ncbi:MAG TPA: TfoX/Sxy family protein [Candidatus Limnocylindria bacterium]|nr:TfoX/Sxy family protein [Candidatus Limnocylindria bacterium]
MAYDQVLAERIRAALAGRDNVTEQKMFGGIAFMVNGRMAVGVTGDKLMVRVGAEAHEAAVARPHARPMDFTGRPMRGFVSIDPAGVAADADLARWVEEGAAFAAAQPPKTRR